MNTILSAILFIIKDKAWLNFQAIQISLSVIMSFFTLYLLNLELSEKTIILFFSLLFIFKAILLGSIKSFYLKNEKLLQKIICILIILSFFTHLYVSLSSKNIVFFLIGVFFLMLLSSFHSINGLSSLQDKIKKENKNEILIIATAGILGVLVTSVSLPFVGLISSNNDNFMVIFSLFFVLISIFINLNTFNKTVKSEIKEYKKVPNDVRMMCFLGFFMNGVVGFGRQFIMPMLFFSVGIKYGLGTEIFKYFGFFLGFVSIITLFLRAVKLEDIGSYNLMLRCYLISVFLWLVLSISIYQYAITDNDNYLIAALLFISIQDAVAKFWTSGYLAELKKKSERNIIVKNSSTLYKSYFYSHIRYSNFGIFVVYSCAYVFYENMPMSLMLGIFSIIAFIYGLIFLYINKKAI